MFKFDPTTDLCTVDLTDPTVAQTDALERIGSASESATRSLLLFSSQFAGALRAGIKEGVEPETITALGGIKSDALTNHAAAVMARLGLRFAALVEESKRGTDDEDEMCGRLGDIAGSPEQVRAQVRMAGRELGRRIASAYQHGALYHAATVH